ncbi:transposase [Providencia rettgeri]|nr:transposase [Providencia rettgeri]
MPTTDLSQEEMIRRYVNHIPARHFKMIRYYGFLANRKRGSLLPKVYDALDMNHPNEPEKPGFAALIKGFLIDLLNRSSNFLTMNSDHTRIFIK